MIRHILKVAEIIWCDLGEVHEAQGHEQAKKRPCIIIKNFDSLQLVIIIPLTTKSKPYPTVVRINKSESGLPEDSFALCHQLRVISHDRIVDKKIGILPERSFNRIRSVLQDILLH